MIWKQRLLISFILAGIAQPLVCQPSQPNYTVHDLGTLSGSNSFPPGPVAGIYEIAGINNAGQVIGSFMTLSLDSHAFRAAPNSAINTVTDDLGTLGGSVTSSRASAVNSSGQVVGPSFRTAPNSPINPATDHLGGGYPRCMARGINDLGQAVGFCTLGMAHQNAGFRTAPNSPINSDGDFLGTLERCCLGSFTVAVGINNSGQVVGFSGSQSHAFRTAANSTINPATDDLGTLGGSLSQANAINNAGQVVGDSTTSDGQIHAFRTAAQKPINPATDDLGTLGGSMSVAIGINNSGHVVGSSSTGSGAQHAFLYSGSIMADLNNLISANSGWTLTSAVAINDLGQIAGKGVVNGVTHAVRLDPGPAR
jgi:probable HAF family extracellular repeat protein